MTLQKEARGHIADDGADSAFHASELLDRAHRDYLRTSIRARIVRGLEDLGDELTAGIRAARRIIVSHSTHRGTPLSDPSIAQVHALSQIANAKDDDARAIFLRLIDLTDYTAELAAAENTRKNFALLTNTPCRTIEKDGRVSAVTGDTKKEVFGVPSPMWHQMMRSHEYRVHTVVPQLLHPVWQHLHETQQWSHSDFVDIASPERHDFQRQDDIGWNGTVLRVYGRLPHRLPASDPASRAPRPRTAEGDRRSNQPLRRRSGRRDQPALASQIRGSRTGLRGLVGFRASRSIRRCRRSQSSPSRSSWPDSRRRAAEPDSLLDGSN